MTTGAGCPVADKLNSLTVGPRGPLLMQDNVFLDEMSRFDRERIPERVVHANGSGVLQILIYYHMIFTQHRQRHHRLWTCCISYKFGFGIHQRHLL